MRPGAGDRDQKRVSAAGEMIVQALLRDPGFDGDQAELAIHVEDPVETGQVENHTPLGHRVGAAVSPVVAGADRIEGYGVAPGDVDDGHHIID